MQFSRPHALSATPIDVAVTIRAVRCGKKAAQLVQDFGVNLRPARAGATALRSCSSDHLVPGCPAGCCANGRIDRLQTHTMILIFMGTLYVCRAASLYNADVSPIDTFDFDAFAEELRHQPREQFADIVAKEFRGEGLAAAISEALAARRATSGAKKRVLLLRALVAHFDAGTPLATLAARIVTAPARVEVAP